jgi:DNA polymerase III delta prime subunit
MEEIKKALKDNSLHHAYLIPGDIEEAVGAVLGVLEDGGIKIANNPDIWNGKFENFGIDESRILRELGIRKPIGDRRFLIVSFPFITIEAQNALLKLFEEPVANTHFFIISPSADIFIPTLKSRLLIINFADSGARNAAVDPKKFLHSDVASRLKMIDKITEDKNKTEALIFLDLLEKECAADLPKYADLLEQIFYTKKELKSRSPSVKMLLEHVACVV